MIVPRRVLVLRASGIGDLLTALPAMRAIRRAYPRSHVVGALPRPLERLVADCLDEVIDVRAAVSPDGLRGLDQHRTEADLAINLHGRGPESHRALLRQETGRVVAYRHEEINIEGPPWMPNQHEVDRWVDLVNITLTLDADPTDLHLNVPAVERDNRLVVLHPGASNQRKQWPWERFAALARALHEAGDVVTLTGDARDRDTVERIRSAAGLPTGAALAGLTDIDALLSVIARARLVVSGDTGVGHIATALGTPSVLLFGVTDPTTWGPRSGPHLVLRGEGMGGIGVEQVLEAANGITAHA